MSIQRVIRFLSLIPLIFLFLPSAAFAAEGGGGFRTMNIPPDHYAGVICIVIFVMSYALVLLEEKIHLRKSKPVMLGAALIWFVIAIVAPQFGVTHDELHEAVVHGLEEYSALLLFLLAAMTYISALQERDVFAALRGKLVQAGLNMRQMFWATGILAFCLSPVADNLTTALVMGAVVMAVGKHDPKFVALACINVVCAANAGGAFSPFGDITTLMVWQAGHVEFFEFFSLFIPSVICFLVPAIPMSFFVSKDLPEALKQEVHMKRGAKLIIFLGVATIATAVSFEQLLGLPPFMGMMAGLSVLMMAAYGIQRVGRRKDKNFDVLKMVALAEWDTLLFFFGVMFSVSGLTYLGYMGLASETLYQGIGPSATNILMGLASAVIDNIPIMFSVLSMNPEMSHFQWLLITLTTGVGGSLLSVGSAAGVALMGVAYGHYTFMKHLKWTPVIALGYAAAIWAHFLINGSSYGGP